MNSAAISVLAEAGIQGHKAEVALRSILAELASPSEGSRSLLDELGVAVEELDPSYKTTAEIVRRLADAGFSESMARAMFGARGAAAFLALIARVEHLEALQPS